MKRIILSVTAATAVFLTGCGSSSNDTNNDVSTQGYDITVERGPVIGAFVVDNNGKRAMNIGDGVYRFDQTPEYPISSYGGYIDVNRDGVINSNDTMLKSSLKVAEQNRKKITIATTLASNESLKAKIMTMLGISEDHIFDELPSTSSNIAAISDQVFKYCIENNVSVEDINETILDGLQAAITSEIELINISEGELVDIVTQNEIELVQELNITLEDANLTQIEVEVAQSSVQEKDPSSLVEAMGEYDLSQEDQDGLVFMYQEEKVARDVYLYLYEKWGLRVFNSIASSEQQHMDAVKALIEKYNLPLPSDDAGVFEDEALASLYETLIQKGETSPTDALEVGVLVEETDIEDLLDRIEYAPEDIKVIYQNLLNGSYNHLNAFNKQL